jgi:hypothetical protein
MQNTRKLVDSIETVVNDYRGVATEAIKSGENKVYVPANIDEKVLNYLAKHPENITQSNSVEPCYASLAKASAGRNEDGSRHKGYIVIDPIAREVVDLVDDKGNSKLNLESKAEVWHISGHELGLGIGTDADIEGLSRAMGRYVIVDERMWTYADMRCRCPCLDADTYLSKETAERKAASIRLGERFSVEQINPDFLQRYKAARETRR